MPAMLAQVEGWATEFDRLLERVSSGFARPEVRRRAAAFVCGLLSNVERKNGWLAAGRTGRGDHPGWDAAAADQRPLGR